MAKRIAEKELTDRNWDQEDEGEEGESAGAFKTFKGFSLTASAPAAGATFSTFGNGAGFKPLSSLTNGSAPSVIPFRGFNSTATVKTNTGTSSSNGSASSSSSLDSGDIMANGSAPSLPAISGGGSSSKEYNRQLTALNCSVRDWITKHVNDNPLCDLNPIFRDYERHLATIERKYGSGAAAEEQQPGKQANTKTNTTSSSTSSNVTPAAPALFSFTKNKDSAAPEKSSSIPAGVSFNFGQKVDSSVLSSLKSAGASGFPFSLSTTAILFDSESTGTSTGNFSFTAAKTEAASNSQAADQNGADEETDEPPVPVVREIKEKDAFYSKKCKLFYKKENEFKEKGVGTMHLKLVSDSKLQLLVRADTNLGNILLNIMVHSSMPCTRTGKNNVMVVCVPNPPVDDKNPSTPVPMLIRVKTAEDADELHKLLQEKKA
ncbi:nuclear pore complex protein Nup50 isoform X2 [Tachysurus vachellii]|uniref:nuclear pore complex protein Nup50 isoform X2 n=1 Tax=Tachysurus vachellii TaxID=175792 RepID=UPI00296B44E8|nr:nuclear pore complex protein Nup50 isoform X2 [Tachysurus vachellii]